VWPFARPSAIFILGNVSKEGRHAHQPRQLPSALRLHKPGRRLMPRLREIPRAEVTDETILRMYKALFGDRDPVAEPGTATGTRGDWWTVFANSPDVFEHAVNGFALYRGNRKLDPVLRELGQTRVGWA